MSTTVAHKLLHAGSLKKALFLLAGFALLYAVRWFIPHTVPESVFRDMKFRLQNEYAPPGAIPVADRVAFDAAQKLRNSVTIGTITAKGLLYGKYLRAEVSVAGGPPPDGRRVRYYIKDPLSGFLTDDFTGYRYYINLW